jgi:hypothetical protein
LPRAKSRGISLRPFGLDQSAAKALAARETEHGEIPRSLRSLGMTTYKGRQKILAHPAQPLVQKKVDAARRVVLLYEG